jgi:hypothetical protein
MFRLKNSSDAHRKDQVCLALVWLEYKRHSIPRMQRAVEVQEDLRDGRYDGEQESGDPPEAGDGSDKQGNQWRTDA